MKQFGKVRTGSWFLVFIGITIGALLGGCLKDDNQIYQVAAVRALNAVPGSPQLDVFLDQNKLNFDSDVWQEEAFAFTDTLPYKNAWPNNRVVSIVDPADYPNAKPLVQKTVNFLPGKFYSLYLVGYDDVEVLYMEDDLTNPPEGKATIRFIHLSPDAPRLDFEIDAGTGEPFHIDDYAFKEFSDFMTIDGDSAYHIRFIAHNSEDVLHTFEFTPAAGMIYTVWVKGLVDNIGDTTLDFDHGIIIH